MRPYVADSDLSARFLLTFRQTRGVAAGLQTYEGRPQGLQLQWSILLTLESGVPILDVAPDFRGSNFVTPETARLTAPLADLQPEWRNGSATDL